MLKKENLEQITRYADMFSAMGTELTTFQDHAASSFSTS